MKKRNILYSAVVALTAFTLSSCNGWLDVPVDGQRTSKELFVDGDGYRSALHGLYNSMSRPTLYGKELQYGLIDFFSNQYMTSGVPERYFTSAKYTAAAKRNFQDPVLLPELDNIFLAAYRIIAESNSLIANVSGEPESKFMQGEMERNMILGEALAVRAFIHFDMLRLYAPAPVQDDSRPYIPYITTFPEILGTHITVKEFINKVIDDLEKARKLVKPYDETPLGISTSVNGNARYYNELLHGLEGASEISKVDAFFMGRGYRFSYWAITALLARVYQYGATFDDSRYDLAATCANEVINAELKANNSTYNPFKDEYFAFKWSEMPDQMQDLRMVSNLIFAVYNTNQVFDASVDTNFPQEPGKVAGQMFIVDVNGQDIFKTVAGTDDSENDIRYTRLLYTPRNTEVRLSTKWYVPTGYSAADDTKLNILPLIRTSEMRYIIAETAARRGNYTEAYGILNEMRTARNLSDSQLTVASTWDDFMKDLVREAQREWISEGQLFYLYKRLNAGVKRSDGTTAPFTKEESVLPLPVDENL